MASSKPVSTETLRFLLAGKTGSGKSSTANSILGKDKFKTGFGSSSMTQISQQEEREWDQYMLQIMDSPGLFDTDKTHKEIAQQVVQALFDLRPGPHFVLYVTPITSRYTEEEFNTYQRLKKYYGKGITKHMIVVFTQGDALEEEDMEAEEYIKSDKLAKSLKKVLRECGNRYIVFNNKAFDKEPQVNQLMKVVLELYEENEKKCFKDSYPLDIANALKQLHLKVKEAERKELEEKETFIRVEKEKKKAELARQREEEERKKADERARAEQQARQRAEEEQRKAQEQARAEQQARQRAQEEQRKAQEQARAEQQARQKAQEEQRKAQEQARAEQQARERAQEEQRIAQEQARAEQQARQKAQEEHRKAQEQARAEQQARQRAQQQAEEKFRIDQEKARLQAEEQRRQYEARVEEERSRHQQQLNQFQERENRERERLNELARRRPGMMQRAEELRKEAASKRNKSLLQYAFAIPTLGLSTIGAGDRQDEADQMEAEASRIESEYMYR